MIIKQREPKTCVACVCAMATGNELGDFKSFIGKEPPYSDIDAYRYLIYCGYSLGIAIECGGVQLNEDATLTAEFKIKDNPAYVIIETGVKLTHAVYWNGEEICDPAPGIIGHRPLSSYKVISWLPINKIEERKQR